MASGDWVVIRVNDITVIINDEVHTITEEFIQIAVDRQIPMEPRSDPSAWDIRHYCPMCHNGLNPPTVRMFKNGSYCDRCGQKIKWGDCSD